MRQRQLGPLGPMVGEVGLGCMGMSEGRGPTEEGESIRALHRALDLGVNLLDTADSYALGENEILVGKAIAARRDEVFLTTKFGIIRENASDGTGRVSGTPDYVRQACDASLARLGTDRIDLYFQHRVDPSTPIEETVGAMQELVKAGKVRYLGLSGASAATIRRAAKIAPIAAVECEYSLFTREIENDGTIEALRELGIALVAYSPMGRGLLTGAIVRPEDLAPGDRRLAFPRFQGENLRRNTELIDAFSTIARKLEVTPTQLALAWVHAQGGNFVPIPGTKRSKYVEENARAAGIRLTPETLAEIERAVPRGSAFGERGGLTSEEGQRGTKPGSF